MSQGMSRRGFLKSSVAGMGGFFFISPNEPKRYDFLAQKGQEKKIIYRTLGKTGIRVPAVNMGVMNSDNPNLVRAALDSGVVFLDTAQVYQRGTNEAMIGEVLKGRPRESFVIATKARLPNNQNTGLYNPAEATEEAYTKKIEVSLKSLGLETIDIYYHHNVWARESVVYEPIMNALAKAKKAGKIRFTGITTHRNEPEIIRAVTESKFYDVILTAYHFKQNHREEVKQAIAAAAKAGIAIVDMKPLGGKQLQDKETVDAVAALKWVLQDPHVDTIVPGFTTFDQMEQDLSVMKDPTLTMREKASLERALAMSGLYCQGCETCLASCYQKLPIPDLMRAYMYVYGYRNLSEAQDVLLSLNLPANMCGDCSECPVVCANGFRVSERVRNIARLREVPPEFIA
jgi:uncharacterized protein